MQRPKAAPLRIPKHPSSLTRPPNLTVSETTARKHRNKNTTQTQHRAQPSCRKAGRPARRAGNNIAFNYECCNYIVIAARSSSWKSSVISLVSGPHTAITRRYARLPGVNPCRDHLTAHRSSVIAESGFGFGAGWVR